MSEVGAVDKLECAGVEKYTGEPLSRRGGRL